MYRVIFLFLIVICSCVSTLERQMNGTWHGIKNSGNLILTISGSKWIIYEKESSTYDTLEIKYKSDSIFIITGFPWSGGEEELGVSPNQKIIILDDNTLVYFDSVWFTTRYFEKKY